VCPAGIVSPHIQKFGIDVVVDLWGHRSLFAVGGTFESVMFDGNLVNVCIDWDYFFLLSKRRISI
jgi:hypothetical protein